MNTILVPTDFSETARNASRYAFEFARHVSATKIVLYNAYQAPYAGDPTLPVVQLFDFEEVKKSSTERLESFRRELLPVAPEGLAVETRSTFAILAGNIEETCEETAADLILMGITGGSGLDVLIGSNTLSVAEQSKVPVIIVPSNAVYRPIQKLLLVLDNNKVAHSGPVKWIKKMIDETGARLQVLNIDHSRNTPDNGVLREALSDYDPEYHHVDYNSFWEATNNFAGKQQVDMIIVIQKKHGFFDNIFRHNHTKELAFHTHVPLMCISEQSR
ncbi:hypothetical protein EXU57_22250 [Segetibacter sp. 3557_3]|uniref:universal stress protein n=1 Tax=Segetibacter sp. 3557_3 TaxID=2547429 RepID=UPI001058F9EC|nr:universal stress protein [Segetibacter sp. 3557_3]TDH19784.1 hypothetical protein EXU57_22250 [Segetibacter sp. 3557_3]